MRRTLLLAIVLIATSIPGAALAQPAISTEIAPQGKLRVSLNAATAVLLTRTSDGTITGGVGVELGRFIAGKFGAVLELVAYPNSNTYVETFGKGEWDIGFGSKTPLTADKADFIAEVLLNEYWFIAAPGREFSNAAQVDRPELGWGLGLTLHRTSF